MRPRPESGRPDADAVGQRLAILRQCHPHRRASAGAIPLNQAVGVASCGDGSANWCMPAGTYRLSSDSWPREISFEIPEGWFPYVPNAEVGGRARRERPRPHPEGSGWGPMFLRVGEVSKDPCDASAGRFPAAADDDRGRPDHGHAVVARLRGLGSAADRGRRAHGRLVTVTSTRTETDCAGQSIWTTPGGTQIDAYPMVGVAGQPRSGTFRILDVDGTLVVIRTTDFCDPSPHELDQGVKPDPTRHAADQVELQGIIDSIQIGS